MGKSTQYRNWALTWNTDSFPINGTTKDGHRFSIGGYTYVIFVGPEESPDDDSTSNHRHVCMHCETSNISKKKVKEALVEYSSLAPVDVETAITYISKIETTKSRYLLYCYKSEYNTNMSKDDKVVKDTISDIRDAGRVPSQTAIKRKLIDDHGASAFNKKFCKIVETYVSETDIVDPRGNPVIHVDSRLNCVNFTVSLLCWLKIIHATNIETGYIPWKHLPGFVLKRLTYMLSLLPYFTKRVQGTTDNLPSLYLYGVQCAGKSSLFSNCKYIKKIATDSSGVSRFRMDKLHTAILLDDIETDTINNKENSSTLKQLSLGGDVEVKIMGSTQSIKGFVIITSNDVPSYIDDNPPIDTNNDKDKCKTVYINKEVVNMSWRRRFVTCKFDTPCPFDSDSVNYDDFKLRDIAAFTFYKMYNSLSSDYKEALAPLQIYYNVVLNDYIKDDLLTWFDDIMEDASVKVNYMLKHYTLEDSIFRKPEYECDENNDDTNSVNNDDDSNSVPTDK